MRSRSVFVVGWALTRLTTYCIVLYCRDRCPRLKLNIGVTFRPNLATENIGAYRTIEQMKTVSWLHSAITQMKSIAVPVTKFLRLYAEFLLGTCQLAVLCQVGLEHPLDSSSTRTPAGRDENGKVSCSSGRT